MEGIGTSQPRVVNITGLVKASHTHGIQLKCWSGQPGVSSTLTFGTTILGTKTLQTGI